MIINSIIIINIIVMIIYLYNSSSLSLSSLFDSPAAYRRPSSTATTTGQAPVVDRAVSTKFVARLRPADLHRPLSSEFLLRQVDAGQELARKTVPSRSSPTKTQLEAAVLENDQRIGSAGTANVFFVATSGTRMSSPATFKRSVVREPSPLSSCGRHRRRRVAGIKSRRRSTSSPAASFAMRVKNKTRTGICGQFVIFLKLGVNSLFFSKQILFGIY